LFVGEFASVGHSDSMPLQLLLMLLDDDYDDYDYVGGGFGCGCGGCDALRRSKPLRNLDALWSLSIVLIVSLNHRPAWQ
jgi:hypothetical protein